MNTKNSKIGQFGENRAVEYLIKNKWTILNRNFRTKFGEIDIIAKSNKNTLIFVEVKTMVISGATLGTRLVPEDNLSPGKHRKLARMAMFFTGHYPQLVGLDEGWQIDLIAIRVDPEKRICHLRHYENI